MNSEHIQNMIRKFPMFMYMCVEMKRRTRARSDVRVESKNIILKM